jgi:predicted TIM-barrel enzyme/protein-tyrosine-phosphatase
VLPVIHVESLDQTLRNMEICVKADCDGVFLINHGMSAAELLKIHTAVRRDNREAWIGVNCLGVDPAEVFPMVTDGVSGIWVDNAMVDERTDGQPEAERIERSRLESGWNGLYFGGVAFKYQRRVSDLERAARTAARYMDVVTTSGPGTGQSPEIEKIGKMREALGGRPLAIASGITPENINLYVDKADCFLVATGISNTFTELNPDRVLALVEKVHSYEGESAGAAPAGGGWCRRPPGQVCFVCEWNEGRSAHLELSVRHKLRAQGCDIHFVSAGLSQGGRINTLRREFMGNLGIPREEIEAHRAQVFGVEHAASDLILVAELQMKHRLLDRWPEIAGRVMTVRGFLEGLPPDGESISESDAHIEDAGGHSREEKIVLYRELEAIAEQVASRLIKIAPV